MGGRGGKGGFRSTSVPQRGMRTGSSGSSGNPQANNTNTNTSSVIPHNPNILNELQNMTDSELAALANSSKGVDMPNFLADRRDRTQEFVYTIGLNEAPQVLDDDEFDQYLKDHNISRRDIMARSVNPVNYINQSQTHIHMTAKDVSDMLKDSAYNYIGGKYGGQAMGAGTYFEQNGGHKTSYGGSNASTICAVLSDKAKVIGFNQLYTQGHNFAQSHPQFERAVGRFGANGNESIYALAMGYNVIYDRGSDYYNVIDRSALVIRKNDI